MGQNGIVGQNRKSQFLLNYLVRPAVGNSFWGQECGFCVDLVIFSFADLILMQFCKRPEGEVFEEQHWYLVMVKTHV